MKIDYALGNDRDANGQAALALAVHMLDVLASKTELLTEGEVSLILTNALHSLPDSSRDVDDTARQIITNLKTKIRKPSKGR